MSILLFLHRWVGVVLALFMLVWFSTGLSIAFIGSPTIDRAQRLAHAPALLPQDGWLSLGEALTASAPARAQAVKAGGGGMVGGGMGGGAGRARADHGGAKSERGVADARLLRIGEEPVWLVEDDAGRRFALSATTGALLEFDREAAERIARDWLGAPSLLYLDTVEAAVGLRNAEALKPFHRFAVGDAAGTQIIVSARSGEVAQVATRVERAFVYAGNWLHLFRWLDALGAGDYRRDALTYAGFFAAVGAFTGIVLGWIKWKPGFFGRPTYARGRTQPYRESWLKYHFWAGLIGGTFAFGWAASGFLSTNPGQIFSQATASREELGRYRGGGLPQTLREWRPSAALGLSAEVVELSWSRLGEEALLIARSRDGARRAVSAPGAVASLGEPALRAAAERLKEGVAIAGAETLADYDSYYFANHRQTALDKPLPVLRVDFADAERTSLYIDLADGRLLAKFDTSRRAYRWLYSAVHHWDFGWFRNHWLWWGWMGVWISFGVALSASAVVLAWRRLRRSLPAPQAASGEKRESRAAQTA
ncbi:PepSY domain-containing protein [Methylosinus sp. RM1]|uniref:PepSY domain-containing protein n=1 Tax=Methylosinus sp. RM1 TaxID=2583817 RepID=UPI001FEDF2AD|nr:PepSY domain-containing protein [Methylosinus sp. RM1]